MAVKKEVQSKGFYLVLFERLKQGKTPKEISEELGITKQNLNYYLRQLKNKGLIENKGYGVWEVGGQIEHAIVLSKKTVRGHALIWKVKTSKKIDWKEVLKQNNIEFKLVRNCIPRAFIQNKKVWFGKESLTIYEPNSFYGENAIESRKYAVISLKETLQHLSKLIHINILPCEFTPAREHYALIKNDLAKQCNRNGEKIYIRDSNGEWMWIDDSDGLGELETGNHNALVNNIGVQKWYNDMKDTKFQVTPTFILNSITQLTSALAESNKQLLAYEQQNKEHLNLIKMYQEESKSNRKLIEDLISSLKNNTKDL